ncbi:diguanylate cyclase [Photobacterium halotolerans]|uniref:diguanylate cyclase n=1 Tax=Photobacterium halotolerans TaxID=265726 RepID=A0A7X5BJQ6_9GAMM|nr:diguanylate cyclase [Photobacterium halotolerans]NAW85346.1 diguanylate cyclase [Photobacterium halotolerans]NAX45648.1 diguanylate cyclase [Photobacterium halotolerans]
MTAKYNAASDVSELKLRLDQAQLSYRDVSLKSRREIVILKRLIARMSVACKGLDSELDKRLDTLRTDLEQNKDISKIVPHLAQVERLLLRQTSTHSTMERLSELIRQSSESLKRIPALPVQLKRDIHDLLSQAPDSLHHSHQQITQLFGLYDRALKLLTVPVSIERESRSKDNDLQHKLCNELQQIITELDAEGESGEQLLAIRHQLLAGVEPISLVELCLDVLRLALDSFIHERRHSQKFLDVISGDLAALEQTARQTADQGQALHKHRAELTAELGQLSDRFHHALTQYTNLESWRGAAHSLDTSLRQLVERQRSLENREQALLEQLHYHQNRAEHLYQQTQNQHRQIEDLQRRIFLDPLTRVYNRAAFHDRLEHEYRRWIRYQHPLCLAIVNIDHFGDLNDNYGFQAGDKVLKIIARTVHQHLRDTDFIARVGNDEFMLILPDIAEDERHRRLSGIREAILQLPFRFREKNVTISASIGATLFDDTDTPGTVIERGQKALSSAKHAGRNHLIWIA